MKRLALLFFSVLFSVSSYCQAAPQQSKDYYLHKSKSQKTIAWVMLGGGVTLMAVGVAAAQAAVIDDNLGGQQSSFSTGEALAYVGLASSLGSIPLFISAAKNKKRAAEIAFQPQRVLSQKQEMVFIKFQPSLSIKYRL